MATAFLSDDCLKVSFALWEKALGLVRDAQIPLRCVHSVCVVPDGYSVPRGIRAPGLAVPGRVKVGTWRGRGRQLVSVRRGQPALHLRVVEAGFSDVIIGMDGAESLAGALHDALDALGGHVGGDRG